MEEQEFILNQYFYIAIKYLWVP